jgi:glycosyltransferase involved in cell wall biosynthesis
VDPTKGLHVVLRALQLIPEAAVHLDVYGIVQENSEYVESVRTLVEEDPRVSWREPVPSSEVPDRIRAYDALIVPSQWLETGPLVVYESFAAGRPVIGADLGGISEIVTDGQDGVLVSPEHEVSEWSRTLRRLVSKPSLVSALKEKVFRPRTMQDAAGDMIDCYQASLEGDTVDTAVDSQS